MDSQLRPLISALRACETVTGSWAALPVCVEEHDLPGEGCCMGGSPWADPPARDLPHSERLWGRGSPWWALSAGATGHCCAAAGGYRHIAVAAHLHAVMPLGGPVLTQPAMAGDTLTMH
jgi:hypothetical protein